MNITESNADRDGGISFFTGRFELYLLHLGGVFQGQQAEVFGGEDLAVGRSEGVAKQFGLVAVEVDFGFFGADIQA